MGNLEIVILALALAVDAFSVAASVGPRCCPRFGSLRLALSFGTFQGIMPLLGAFLGSLVYAYVSRFDHWVAFALLEVVGIKMLIEGIRGRDAAECTLDPGRNGDPSCGWSLVGLSVATSIDAFGAGIGMQVVGTNLWLASACIAITAFVLTYLGARLGRRAEHILGRKAELVGGAVLVLLGLKMLQI